MSAEILQLDQFRKKPEPKKKPLVGPVPLHEFSPEVQSDSITNDLVAGMFQGLKNVGIDPSLEVNDELLGAVYLLVRAITDRHIGVPNDLNEMRDVQAQHGYPSYDINVIALDEDV